MNSSIDYIRYRCNNENCDVNNRPEWKVFLEQ